MTTSLKWDRLPAFEREVGRRLQNEGSIREDTDMLTALRLIAEKTVEIQQALFQQVFRDIPTELAKSIAKAENSSDDMNALVYGDVEFSSFLNILQKLQLKKGQRLVDLGHGTGRALVIAATAYADVLSEVVGIEISKGLVQESRKCLAKFESATQSDAFGPFFPTTCPVTIREGDFLQAPEPAADGCALADWTTADVVFANSTCFDAELMSAVAEKGHRLRPNALFATLTSSLPSNEFEIIDQFQYCMSWGPATCFIHRRK